MKHQNVRDALTTLAKVPFRFVEASPAFRLWLKDNQCHDEVAEMLCACLVDTCEIIGELFEMNESAIMERTSKVREFCVSGFIAIGTIPNGDVILLSSCDGGIHALDHELLPDEANVQQIFDSFLDVLNATIVYLANHDENQAE